MSIAYTRKLFRAGLTPQQVFWNLSCYDLLTEQRIRVLQQRSFVRVECASTNFRFKSEDFAKSWDPAILEDRWFDPVKELQ